MGILSSLGSLVRGGRDVAISSRFYIFEEGGALKRVPQRILFDGMSKDEALFPSSKCHQTVT
jgi:hypothetical protein